MKIYLVGGAIRDQLLGLPVQERDWVVVGATPQAMLAKHFRPVGKDFPVFLHPETREEYALARTERKSGRGYTGFVVDADPRVTLEEDLMRRDLTINAIAQTENGSLIDPYHGQADLKNKLLRHVSPAFVEDPLRVLRVARFMAQLGPLGFTIAPETLTLMQQMAHSGELEDLVKERVFKELSRALTSTAPHLFIKTLVDCHAMPFICPEISNPAQSMHDVALCIDKTNEFDIRFACLLANCTPEQIAALCARLHVPKHVAELTRQVADHFEQFDQIFSLSSEELLTLLKQLDVFRRPERFSHFLMACHIITEDPEGAAKKQYCHMILSKLQAINTSPLIQQGYTGLALGKAIDKQRLHIIEDQIKRRKIRFLD